MTQKFSWVVILVLLAGACGAPLVAASAPAGRKIVKKVLPAYPELARRLNIKGAVKLQVRVAPNGSVKSAKPLGGNPAFVEAVMDVIEKWKFAPGPEQTTETIELKFEPAE